MTGQLQSTVWFWRAMRRRLARGSVLLVAIAIAAGLMSWTLQGQAPAGATPDQQIATLIQQVAELQSKVRQLERGPSRMVAPFDIVDESGDRLARFEKSDIGGALALFENNQAGVVLYGRGLVGVTQGAMFAGMRIKDDGRGSFIIRNGEKNIAELTGSPEASDAGVLTLNDDEGELGVEIGGLGHIAVVADDQELAGIQVDDKGVARVYVQANGSDVATLSSDGSTGGALMIADSTGTPIVSVAESPEAAQVTIGGGQGSSAYGIRIFNSGQPVLSLGQGKVGGAGAVAAYDGNGTIGAILSGTGQVHVANDGTTLVTMVAEKKQGAFSVRNMSGTTIVRLSEGTDGGLLQLANSGGSAMVEGGVLEGRGIVRAYPLGHPGMGMLGMPGTFISGTIK